MIQSGNDTILNLILFSDTVFLPRGGGGGGVNWTTGWKFIIVRENENQHSKINLVRCSKLWNWQIQTLLATQFNSKESVDLCSFWKVATLEKGGVWGA